MPNSRKQASYDYLQVCNNGLILRDIQEVLKEKEYYYDALDGDWGSNTRNAVKQYQRDKGINPPTGYLNQETCEDLSIDYDRMLNSRKQAIQRKPEEL
jgi:peptidoglycan hydrolase-like protein with peptidoglycan-binding domain